MAYNENINLFVTTDRNNADVFNAPLEKIIQNIQDTREYLYQLQTELDQLESKVQSEYTPTEQLNDLLANGVKGDKGDTGEGLEYNWDGTALGVKLESESDFTYRELKGEPGDVSTEQLEEALTDYPTLEYLEESLQDYVTNTTLQDYATNTTLQDYVTNSGLTTTLNNYPTNSDLATQLSYYPTNNSLTTTLNNYPTNSDLATTLSNYETHTGVTNKLNNYVTKTNFNNAIGGMLTISQANGTYATQTQANSNTTEINNLKNTVVSGKTSVANAINGKLGTKLSNQTSFADMALYIGTIPMFSVENLYVGGYYLATPPGVGVKYVIIQTESKSPASSNSDGYVTAEFTNNAQNAYTLVTIRGNYDGTRKVTTLKPKNVNRTGTVTVNIDYLDASSDVGTMITIAVFNNPIYDVKALTGDYFICIP